jgi:hypothetical protein
MAPRRTITDGEIALIKAMLGRGMANSAIQFYFNRQDRPVNPGRVSNIKSGAYGAEISPASAAELDAFLAEFKSPSVSTLAVEPVTRSRSERARDHFERGTKGWFLKGHETHKAECKKSFGLKPETRISPILRAVAGLANNAGGFVFVGVDEQPDKTQKVVGLTNAAEFSDMDPAAINALLVGGFDPVPSFGLATFEVDGMTVGAIEVEKHPDPPIITLKQINNDVKEGAVYFRYVGATLLIKPGELRHIIGEREKRAVQEFAASMNKVAAGTAGTVDLDSGRVQGTGGAFVVDKGLLGKIQFIREGEFSERSGAPTLRLIGDVTASGGSAEDRTRIIRANVTPDSVVRNFLLDEKVAELLHYILSIGYSTAGWLPLWYYVQASGLALEAVILALEAEHATKPSHRMAAMQRLLREKSAFHEYVGKPKKLLERFVAGEREAPTDVAEDTFFAQAVQGLPEGQADLDWFRRMLIASLDRAQDSDNKTSARRSYIYRAACRLDELLYRPSPAPGA